MPGGGTTDYAVEVFYHAVKSGKYTCEVPENRYMDMLYMPDALDAMIQVMEADPSRLIHRNSFNITAMSFTPKQLFEQIRKRIPEFTANYNIDPVKDQISASWPDCLDDSCARKEWGWNPKWGMYEMVDDMLKVCREKLARGEF